MSASARQTYIAGVDPARAPVVEALDRAVMAAGADFEVAIKYRMLMYSLGGDYRHFDTPSEPSGAACKAACEAETRCRIWTYVRPGYLGPGASARCYLKDQLRAPRRRPCCVSGVVR